MIIKQYVDRGDTIETKVVGNGVAISIVVSGKHKSLIQSVSITPSDDFDIGFSGQDTVIIGAAKYRKISPREFEDHLKRATSYLLKSRQTDYVVINKYELERLNAYHLAVDTE